MTRYARGQRQALAAQRAAAAISDLGERGAIDAGTRTLARGGTRERRTSRVNASVWYARCAPGTHVEVTLSEIDGTGRYQASAHAVDVAYHYAPSWARMPSDTLRSPQRVRVRLGVRVSVALPIRDVDSGRAVQGAVLGERYTGATFTLTRLPMGARHSARALRARSLLDAGAGL